MDSNDFKQLRTIIREEVTSVVDEKLVASEERLRNEIAGSGKILRGEIVESEKRVVSGIVDFISDHLMPLIDEKADRTDIDRLERKLDFYVDKTIDLKSRVDDIGSILAIAHELKIKKHKKAKD